MPSSNKRTYLNFVGSGDVPKGRSKTAGNPCQSPRPFAPYYCFLPPAPFHSPYFPFSHGPAFVPTAPSGPCNNHCNGGLAIISGDLLQPQIDWSQLIDCSREGPNQQSTTLRREWSEALVAWRLVTTPSTESTVSGGASPIRASTTNHALDSIVKLVDNKAAARSPLTKTIEVIDLDANDNDTQVSAMLELVEPALSSKKENLTPEKEPTNPAASNERNKNAKSESATTDASGRKAPGRKVSSAKRKPPSQGGPPPHKKKGASKNGGEKPSSTLQESKKKGIAQAEVVGSIKKRKKADGDQEEQEKRGKKADGDQEEQDAFGGGGGWR